MNVTDLRLFLSELPPEMDSAPVILQKDSEGNGYSPLHAVDAKCFYVAESSYAGDVYNSNDERPVGGVACICLAPTN